MSWQVVCIEWKVDADGNPYDVRGAKVEKVGANQYRVTTRSARRSYLTSLMFFPPAPDGGVLMPIAIDPHPDNGVFDVYLSAVNNYGVYSQAPDAGSIVRCSLALDHPDGVGA